MARALYTATKGLFEDQASNTTGLFSISDVSIDTAAASAGLAGIKYIRVYDQSGADGDDYAGLDEVTFTITDSAGTQTVFEIDNDGDSTTSNEHIALNALDLTTRTPTQIAAEIVTAINTVYGSAGEGTLFAKAQSEVDADGTADSGDYVDIYIFASDQNAWGLDGGSTTLPVDTLQTSTRATTAGGAYLAAGRTDDDADVEADLGGFSLGALSNGSNPGEIILLLNNSTNRSLIASGAFVDSGGTTDTQVSIAAGEGSLLCWSGSAWGEIKYLTGQATFSTP